MKVIKDEQKLINIHPLVVYFMLSEDEFVKYDNAIEQLNSYKGFIRKIFKFQAIKKAKKFGGVLPVTDSLKDYNMMVRIVDDAEGNFYYALHNVNLDVWFYEDREDSVESVVHAFLTEVCTLNIEHINQRLTALSDTTAPDSPQIDNLKQLMMTFHSALLQRKPDRGTWAGRHTIALYSGCEIERPCPKTSFEHGISLNDSPIGNESLYADAHQVFRSAGLSSDDAECAVEVLWDLMETEFHLPKIEVSTGIAKGMIDQDNMYFIFKDWYTRFKPKCVRKIRVSAEIKRLQIRTRRDGTKVYGWGIEFRVNGKPLPIYFGSKPETMIYVCTLLRAKVGEKMYIHEFYNNSHFNNGGGRRCKFQRNRSKEWLEQVYHILFPTKNEDYSIWVAKIDKGRGHPLSQGISRACKKVQDLIQPEPLGMYYCVIDTLPDENRDKYYEIRIEPDSIIVPKEMQPLLDMIDDIIVDSPSRFPREIRE